MYASRSRAFTNLRRCCTTSLHAPPSSLAPSIACCSLVAMVSNQRHTIFALDSSAGLRLGKLRASIASRYTAVAFIPPSFPAGPESMSVSGESPPHRPPSSPTLWAVAVAVPVAVPVTEFIVPAPAPVIDNFVPAPDRCCTRAQGLPQVYQPPRPLSPPIPRDYRRFHMPPSPPHRPTSAPASPPPGRPRPWLPLQPRRPAVAAPLQRPLCHPPPRRLGRVAAPAPPARLAPRRTSNFPPPACRAPPRTGISSFTSSSVPNPAAYQDQTLHLFQRAALPRCPGAVHSVLLGVESGCRISTLPSDILPLCCACATRLWIDEFIRASTSRFKSDLPGRHFSNRHPRRRGLARVGQSAHAKYHTETPSSRDDRKRQRHCAP